MVINNPQSQKAIQNAVRASCRELDGEKIFADNFAKLCEQMDLNKWLPNGMKPIKAWVDVDYVCPPKTLFRRLGMKEPERFKFNEPFVAATFQALISAMPETIRLNLLNSLFSECGVRVVSEIDANSKSNLTDIKLSLMKEAGDLLATASNVTSDSSSQELDDALKEALEAAESIEEYCKRIRGFQTGSGVSVMARAKGVQ